MTKLLSYKQFITDVTVAETWCDGCRGYHKEMTGYLPDNTRVIILQTGLGFHVHVGPGGSLRLPVKSNQVEAEIVSQWRELSGEK